ncbi:MAG TPA: hypothetical protein PK830_02480 [Candidatus Atribacteria bacterium]|nr:hypothetical protein [Candidatus Atribacteria bacterium]HPT77960.1 hypothetical protein [Candidatus Atribacteria bacterium]
MSIYRCKRGLALVLVMVCAAALTGCFAKSKNTLSMARWEDDVFVSEWAGFKLTVPEGWYVATDEEIKETMNLGAEVIAGATGEAAEKYKAVNAVYPLYISKYPLDSEELNPNAMIVFEKLSALQNLLIKDADSYIESTMQQLEDLNIGYSTKKGDKVVIAGEEYSSMTATLELIEDLSLIQRYYSRVHDGYIISFILTGISTNPEELDNIVKSIEKY